MKRYLFIFCLLIGSFLQASAYDIVVAKDGSGDYRTIQEAIDAVPLFRLPRTVIYVKNGVYKEKVIVPEIKKNIHLIGEDKFKTILTYDDFAQRKNKYDEPIGTSGSASFYCIGEGFVAENLTFENSAGPVGQAVAIWVGADKAIFYNCRFLGFQDTLYTYGKGARQLYLDCYVEGTVDFIFGSSTAWFENCEILCKQKGYITAASTPQDVKYGYVFYDCKIKGDEGVQEFYLGRPWRPYAKVLFTNCEIPAFVKAEGWHNWGKVENETTAYFAEHNNVGVGSGTEGRVSWSHQLPKNFDLVALKNDFFADWKVWDDPVVVKNN